MTAIVANGSPSGAGVIYKKRVSIDYGTVATAITEEGTATFAEADAADGVTASPIAALTAGLVVASARVSATGVVAIALGNVTGGTLTPNTVTFDVYVTKGGTDA